MATETETPETINGLTLFPSVRKAWVEALRSGDYAQGRQYLRRGGDFCCLGVLCEVAVSEGVIKARPQRGMMLYDGEAHWPGPALREWAGQVQEPNASDMYTWATTEGNLTGLNDSGEYTFDQIADIIEGKNS